MKKGLLTNFKEILKVKRSTRQHTAKTKKGHQKKLGAHKINP